MGEVYSDKIVHVEVVLVDIESRKKSHNLAHGDSPTSM